MTIESEVFSDELQKELSIVSGLKFEDDRFDNMPYSLLHYPAFQAHLNELLEEGGCHLEQPPKKGTRGYRNWDSSIGFNAFDLQRHTASVDEHTDDVSKSRYFGLYVLKANGAGISSRRSKYFDTRTELRYTDQFKNKQRTRLDQGTLLVFNPRMKHELIHFGDLTLFALFDVKKVKKQ